jgi:hypothetical protein
MNLSEQVISLGEHCLLGANAGLGFSLGDDSRRRSCVPPRIASDDDSTIAASLQARSFPSPSSGSMPSVLIAPRSGRFVQLRSVIIGLTFATA